MVDKETGEIIDDDGGDDKPKKKSYYDKLKEQIDRGKTEDSITTGFERLNTHVGIYRSTFYLVGGYSGSGKSTLVSSAFILNPFDWYLANKGKTQVKLKIIYFSMERNAAYTFAKWVSRRIFLDKGVIISVNKIVGRGNSKNKLSPLEEKIIDEYKGYLDEMMDFIEVIDGPQNPMGIKKHVVKYAREHGKTIKIGEYQYEYVPDDPHEIVLIIYDHIGLLKKETRTERDDKGKVINKTSYNSKKEIIDLACAEAQEFRDTYGYSPVFVSQFNRSIANPIRIKNGDVSPAAEDFKESSDPYEACDVALALFDPIRYIIAFPERKDTLGYELDKLRDSNKVKKYRSLSVLKNTYGADDIGIGLAFQPICGLFKEMPPLGDVDNECYNMIQDDSYFLLDKPYKKERSSL